VFVSVADGEGAVVVAVDRQQHCEHSGQDSQLASQPAASPQEHAPPANGPAPQTVAHAPPGPAQPGAQALS
jgi:hypothetical protein